MADRRRRAPRAAAPLTANDVVQAALALIDEVGVAGFTMRTAEDPDGDFDLADALRAEQDFAVFAAERAAADETVRGRSLDETFRYERLRRGHQVTDVDLRWVYLHMIEEYARHNGHADMLRERIDGGTGQ